MSGHFGHMVYFTLKERTAETVSHLIAECKKYLSDHPGTVYFSAGSLAETHRGVNDRDFDVALNLIFDSKESHDAYQVAPRHDEFIAANKDGWAKVRVFDSEIA